MFVKRYVLFSVRPGMVDHFNMDYCSIRVVEYGMDGICFKWTFYANTPTGCKEMKTGKKKKKSLQQDG